MHLIIKINVFLMSILIIYRNKHVDSIVMLIVHTVTLMNCISFIYFLVNFLVIIFLIIIIIYLFNFFILFTIIPFSIIFIFI